MIEATASAPSSCSMLSAKSTAKSSKNPASGLAWPSARSRMPTSQMWAQRALAASGSTGNILHPRPSLRSASARRSDAGRSSSATGDQPPMSASASALNACPHRQASLRGASEGDRRGSVARCMRANAGAEMASTTSAVSSQKDAQPSTPPTSLPPLPEKRRVAGCGGAGVDYLASVLQYPKPDDKIRTTELQVQGGGNVGNALTAAARLGLSTRIFTKIADDSLGNGILAELQGDGIDLTHIIIGEGGVSPFTYIIVDQETSTRTCIHTPGAPPLTSDELSDEAIERFLDGADLAYFDARLAPCAVRIARRAAERQLPILLDAEKPREGMNELLAVSDYVVCSENFPQAWTGCSGLGSALLEMMRRLPQLAFVIVTLGASGCVMLDRRESPVGLAKKGEGIPDATTPGSAGAGSADIDATIEQLREDAKREGSQRPVCREFPLTSFHSSASQGERPGAGPTVQAVLAVSTAQKLRPEEVVDTTGAGDAFIGAVLYGLCASLPRARLLALAATVAASKCQLLGARPGLPSREDARLAPYLVA